MFVREKTSKKAKHPTLQIVESYREGDKVRQKTLFSLGVVRGPEEVKRLRNLAESLIRRLQKHGDGIKLQDLNSLEHTQTQYDGFALVVDALLRKTALSDILKRVKGRKTFDVEEITKLLISHRLDTPGSKLRTYERQNDHGFYGVKLQHIYRTMDVLLEHKESLQKQALLVTHGHTPVDCFFFDVTTLYFESVKTDEIKAFGFSKDQKPHNVQVVLCLVVDKEGISVGYETFRGNTGEVKTLLPVMEALKKRFPVNQVTVVCDRGLASKDNTHSLYEAGFNFVIACKLRKLPKKLMLNDLAHYSPLKDGGDALYRVLDHPDYPDSNLIITYSPARAAKDKKDREDILESLEHKLQGKDKATVKKMISNKGIKKFISVGKEAKVERNDKAILEDASWDGFHGIAVSKGVELNPSEALDRYKSLWRVEEAFRVAKSTLKTRPIFHFTPKRIEGHILICFLSLFLERTLERILREKGTPMTPDGIRYALSQVHTVGFLDNETNRMGTMQSKLSEEAKDIFNALNIPLDRVTSLESMEKKHQK